jgi:hypothetical protein
MTDRLSTLYQDLLGGSYDCVDRIVLNDYFRMGHDPGGFRIWWRAITGSDETLDNAHLMRLAGRFSRRVRGYANAQHSGDRLFARRAQARDWRRISDQDHGHPRIVSDPGRPRPGRCGTSARSTISRESSRYPMSTTTRFISSDPEWGHLTIKLSGHPPFPVQVILNGHEYVACQARKAGIGFTKEGNCFTDIFDAAGVAKIAGL